MICGNYDYHGIEVSVMWLLPLKILKLVGATAEVKNYLQKTKVDRNYNIPELDNDDDWRQPSINYNNNRIKDFDCLHTTIDLTAQLTLYLLETKVLIVI